jgi:signal transduction histidine kinase
MGGRRRSVAPAITAGALGASAALTVALWFQAPHAPGDAVDGYAITGLMWTLILGAVGTLVMRDSPRNALGPLLAGIGLWFGVLGVAGALQPLLDPDSLGFALCATIGGLWMLVIPALFLVPVLYPDGVPMTPRWVVPALVLRTCVVVVALGCLISPEITENDRPELAAVNPFGVAILAPVPLVLAMLALTVSVAIGIAAMVAQLRRARRLAGDDRARIGWLLAFFALSLSSFWFSGWTNVGLQAAAGACLGAGVVRHHLFDIRRLLSRSVTYAILVAAALAAALATAAVVGARSELGVLPALAAAVTAVALARGLTSIQRVVDRWVYGPRRDPAEALGLLGDRLAAAADPEDVLPQVVATVRESLDLPFVALRLAGEAGDAAQAGEPGGPTVSYPLRYAGQDVGVLVLGVRDGEDELARRDSQLVGTFAAQAGNAAHSAQMLRELRRSREQLVSGREEERRMLRRDLHDGVGPTLAGITLGLESLKRGAADPAQASLVTDLVAQSRVALDSVRRLARDLRPPPLDELGLQGALVHHAALVARMAGGRPDVRVVVTGVLPALPAAVEVAAYRIAQEAVSNTARHADASSCVVELSADHSLVLSVSDDGSGAVPVERGTGLRSMHERADEVGGSCTVSFRPGAGTVVRAELPLHLAQVDG